MWENFSLFFVHFLSLLIIVPTELFHAFPVSIHAYYSDLNSAMLGIIVLREASWQVNLWGMLKNFGTNLANFV